MAAITKNTDQSQSGFLGAEETPGARRNINYQAFPMVGQAGPFAAVDLHAGCPIRFVNTGGKITCVKAGGGSYTTNTAIEGVVDGYAFQAYLAGEAVCVVQDGTSFGYADDAFTLATPTNVYLSQTAGELQTTAPFGGALPVGRWFTDGKNLKNAGITKKGSLMRLFARYNLA